MRPRPLHRAAAVVAVTVLLVTATFAPAIVGATPAVSSTPTPAVPNPSPDQPTPTTSATPTGPPTDTADSQPALNRTVTLVTGQRIQITGSPEHPSIRGVDGDPIRVDRVANRTYVFPEDVDLSTYDRSLFELETLLARDDSFSVLLGTNASVAANVSGLSDVRSLQSAGVVAAELDPDQASAQLGDLVADGRVHSVALDGRYDTPPRPQTVRTGADRATNRTAEGVRIAVLDTGIDATHSDLDGSVVERIDLVEPNGTDGALDLNGHGTVVAGLAAGSGAGNQTYTGVAPGADLIDVRIMDEAGRAPASRIVEGIEAAVEADADVVLLSVGTSVDGSGAVAESVEWANNQGVVVVAAAGNLGRPRAVGAPGRPAAAITVGATDGAGGIATYSSRGPTLEGHLKPDLVAPGAGTVGPLANGSDRPPVDGASQYTRMGGTSAATPQVAGAAALLLARNPALTAREVENRLVSAARPLDGVPVNAQGGGLLDIDRALDPAIVADPAVSDLGLVETGGTHNRTVALTNHDDRRHDLAFDLTAWNVDLDRPADDVAVLNRTGVSLAPGETVSLTLTIDGNATPGAYAGAIHYTVDGEPRSLPFGVTRGGTVTVEKRPLTPGDRVDGDEIWVLNEQGTHDELLEVENGTASFVAGGGTYVVWSGGVDDATGTTVFLSEHRRFDGPTTVVLDEAETVPVGVDAGPLVEQYGPLANRSVTVSVSTPFGDSIARRSIERQQTDSRAVRVSADPDVAVATEYLLAGGANDTTSLDAPDVFHLVHAVEGVDGHSAIRATPERLGTTAYRYHRTTVDQTYRLQPQATVSGVWNERTFRWYDLGGRTTQRVHRMPGVASYRRTLSGDGWRAHGTSTDHAGSVGVLAHPMLAVADVTAGPNGTARVAATPFADGEGTRFDPAGRHTLTALVDGVVVEEREVAAGSGQLDGLPVGPNESLTVRLAGNNSGGFLSTRTLTEVSVPSGDRLSIRRPGVRDRPPTITDLSIPAANASNAVEPGAVTVTVDADVVGPMASPRVWYATGATDAPPWQNRSAWTAAEVDERDDRLVATVQAPDAGTISVAAAVGDIWGRRTRTMTTNAVHVGAAPNTSTRVISGTIVAEDGAPAANDTVFLDPTDSEILTPVRTDAAGRFAIEVPRTRTYDLVYTEGAPWRIDPTPDDGVPAWHPIQRVSPTEDVDLGTVRLPRSDRLTVTVTDERGEPVEGATVRLRQRRGNVSVTERLTTATHGLATRAGVDRPGIDVAGAVQVTVTPPAETRYTEQTHRFNVTVDGPTDRPVTLETTPPRAALTAIGPIGQRDVVLLQAWKSEVPAGVEEYRWDVDGDGETDQVTTRPLARYELADGGPRPTVTVVDAAGKTDTATVALRNVTA